MRFMILVKATRDSEAGVLVDGAGLQCSAKGWRIQYSKGGQRRSHRVDQALPQPRGQQEILTMPRQIFINLPVRDLERTKASFSALGFGFNPQFTDQKDHGFMYQHDMRSQP